MDKLRNIILIVSALIVSCGNRHSQNNDKAYNIINKKDSLQRYLRTVRTFSENYRADSFSYEGIGALKNTPDSVVYAFKTLMIIDTTSFDRYETLVFLKLYLDHLRCCHQTYEIRNNPGNKIDSLSDPLLYEFALSTKVINVKESQEFISSGIGDTWLSQNPMLLKYPEIKQISADINRVQDSIAKGLYW